MKKSLIALAASGFTLMGANAFALEPYIIGQVGQSDIDAGDGGYVDSLDDTDTYFGVGVGFRITENLAFELSYNDFGEIDASYGETFEDGFYEGKETLALDAVSIAAVGILPVGPSFNVFGKIGLDVWDAEWKDSYRQEFPESSFSESDKLSDDGADVFFAIGASFNVSSTTNIFLEYQKHSFEFSGDAYEDDSIDYDIDADVVALGINFGF